MRHGPIEIVVCPDYSAANPYQTRLAQALPPHLVTLWGGPAEARTRLRQKAEPGRVVLHVHWEDHVHRDASDAADAEARVDAFLEETAAFTREGGALVWTVHNLEPHECRYPAAQKRLSSLLGALAHRVTAHDPSTVAALIERGVAPARLALVAHGNYVGACGDGQDPGVARRALGLPETGVIVGLFGRIRPYKGADLLLDAVERLRSDARVAIVGLSRIPLAEMLAARGDAVTARVIRRESFVPTEEMALWLSAMDAAVLPYRRVTTSGAAMLALSYGVPVIGTAHPGLAELVRDGCEGRLVAPGDAEGLAGAIDEIAGLDAAARAAMAGRAAARAAAFPWAASATVLAGIYADLSLTCGAARRPIEL